MKNILKTKKDGIFVLLIVGFFVLGLCLGGVSAEKQEKLINLDNKTSEVTDRVDFAPFWKVWSAIDEKAPNAGEVNDQDRVYGAISGLMSSLDDPYSVFFSPDEASIFESQIAGNFSGVGMEVGIKDKVLTVIAPLKNTPAYNAGIKSGDKILKIDERITDEISIEEAIKLIRGEKGTTVAITVFRDGESKTREIKIIRDIIDIPTLETELHPDGVFIIRLYSFSSNSPALFRDAMKEFVDANTDKLVLDLRGNPGGYLDAAVDISSWFLSSGKTVVTEDYGDNRKPVIYRSRGYDLFTDQLKFAILIDGGSASASEIVAGAMQDYKRAFLVGAQSFGKGSVQETIKITPDTLLKITVAKWLTPNGNTIAQRGLTPDYKVEVTKKDLDAGRDPQLEKAVEILMQ